MSEIYEGKTIHLQFSSGLKSDIFIKYTDPGTGKPLVFVSDKPVFYFNLSGMGFYKINFWAKKFNKWLIR